MAQLVPTGASRSDSPSALNVRACAIARVLEGGNAALVVHCRVPGAAGARLSTFLHKLVGSKKFQERAVAERSMTVDDSSRDPFSVHCLVPSGTAGAGFVLVLAITAKAYPRRLVFPPPTSDSEAGPQGLLGQLAADVVRECGANLLLAEADHGATTGLRQASLGAAVTQVMERMCAAYENTGGKDKMRALQMQVDEVNGVMQDNVAYPFAPRPSRFSTGLSPPPLGAQWPWQVNTMLRNADQLEDLRGKVTVMGDNSKQFFRLSRDNRVMQQCREYKMRLLIGGVASLFCLVFVLPGFAGLFSGSDDE